MTGNHSPSLFARIRTKLFTWRMDFEIYERIFAHHRREKDFGYPFQTRQQMRQLTEQLDVQPLLEGIEQHIRKMPAAYGESFRYIMHRELRQRLEEFEQLAARRVQPTNIDPRLIARPA